MKNLLSSLTLTLILLLGYANIFASHVPGGNITYECVGPNQYLITLTLFEDCGTAFETNADETIQIANDCGFASPTSLSLQSTVFQQEVSQLCQSQLPQSECNGGTMPGVYMHQWQALVTLPGPCDSWTFSYSSCCRNNSTNATSTSANYYWESVLNSATAPCNTSPTITAQPIPYNCVGQPVNYSLGAYEPDGNTLIYTLIPAMTSATGTITYQGGYTGAQPIPGISVDPNTGVITFTPTTVGNYIVAVLIEEYDVNGNLVGSIIQDFQFEVINCPGNTNPQSPAAITNTSGSGLQTGPADVQLCEGDNICFDVTFTDPDVNDSIYLASNVFNSFPNATFTQTGWIGTATGTICFTVLPGSVPFSAINVTAADNACPVVGVNSFTLGVTVVSSTFAGLDETICLSDGVQLNANGGNNFNWSLVSGDPITPNNFSCTNCQSPIASPSTTSVYEVTSNLAGGCTNVDTVTVNVVPDFQYSLTQSSTTSCLNSDIDLSIVPNPAGNYTYDWTGSFLSSTTVANPTITPSSPGNYDYSVVITSPNGCIKYDTIAVTVASAYAPDVTVTTNLNSIMCGDTIYFDTDLGGGVPATCGPSPNTGCSAASSQQVVGNSTGSNTTTSWPAPFGNWYRNAKHQFLFTAAELQAAGFVGGKITEISWEVLTVNGTSNYNDYQISMGCTGITDLNTWQGGLTQVFGPQNINVTPGWNTLTLTTAYEWDGISNLIVEICYDNLATSYTQNSSTPWTTTTFNSCIYYRSDGTPACPYTTTQTVTTNRPVTRFTTCPTIPDPANYTFEWTPNPGGALNNYTIQNPYALPQVTTDYQLVVTDINGGCTDTVLTNIAVLCDTCQAPIPTVTPVTCFGGADGEVVAAPYGINGPPFDVQLLDLGLNIVAQDPTVTTTTIFSGLTAGDYILRSYDTTGCWADTLVTIEEPPIMTLSVSPDTLICIGGTAHMLATATGGNSMNYSYVWSTLATNTANQSVSPTAATTYTVHALDSLACSSDTLDVTVNMYPPILSTIGPADTVCPGETGVVSVLANGGYGGVYSYDWTDANGISVGTSNPQQVTPAEAPMTYYVSITDGCETPAKIDSVVVDWYPLPQPLISADNQTGCFPVLVNFTNDTDPALVDQCFWDFGDGSFSSDCGTVFHMYNAPGVYDVNLTVTSPEGCVNDSTFSSFIESYSYPTAHFGATPEIIDVFQPTVEFTDSSSADVTSFEWNFGESGILGNSSVQNPTFTFPDDGPDNFDVELIVTNANGCTDTTEMVIIMNGVYNFYVPTGFTPNGDGNNDFFYPKGEGVDVLEYRMLIFDRWGNLVLETDDTMKVWDGSFLNAPAPTDVYIWKIYTKDQYTGEEHLNTGHVTLIR